MSFLTTPKKCSGKRSRKQKTVNQSLKRQKTDNVEDEENHLRDCFLSSSSTSGEDENEEENLEEEIDWKKLEQVLEESAQKANLTAVNVKSILHHILRDKRVIDYAQDIADSVPLPETKVTEATKMTRSKAKLFGQQPLLTALETTKPKSILDLEFSDSSSDDEDFQPGHDTEASQTSDDDMTDRLSDITADARSPRVLTTPKPELNNSLQVIDEGQIMVGAVSTPISKDDLIASRTRSRCPMEDVTVEDLEALFNPPDFEPTSFVPEDLDADELIWQGWLVGLTKPEKSVLNDTNDDDKDDEDFNYMEATAEEEIEIEEELRDDRATRITQKELQGLFNELLLGYDQDAMDNYDELIQELCEEQPQSQSNRFEVPCDSMEAADGLVLTYQMRQQMTAQLQQHVQMLSQVFMLSCTHSWLRNETHQCKQYIEELATFHDKAVQNSQDYLGSLSPELSMFCTPGISDSFNIIKSLAGQKIVTRNPKSQMQKAKKNVTISDTIAEMFTTIPFFATYIELIPKQGPQNEEMQRRTRRKKFLQCEDNLLALGLDQFKGKRYERFEAIKEHLLPIFNPKQLQIRVKNCTSTLKLKYNPIAYVKNEKRVPELENEINITVPRNISEIPLYKLPKMVWKHRFIPNWFLKVDRELGKNEKIILEQKHLKEYEKKNKLFEIAQQHSTPSNKAVLSTPLQLVSTQHNIERLYNSAPIFPTYQVKSGINNATMTTADKTNMTSQQERGQDSTIKNRVNRSLSYSEVQSSLSFNNNSNLSSTSISKENNTSGDGFPLPVNMLLSDLPMPDSLPHLTFSPSKPLHETSFSEVKQFLKTPQKLKSLKAEDKKTKDISLNLSPLKDLDVSQVCVGKNLETPQKTDNKNNNDGELSSPATGYSPESSYGDSPVNHKITSEHGQVNSPHAPVANNLIKASSPQTKTCDIFQQPPDGCITTFGSPSSARLKTLKDNHPSKSHSPLSQVTHSPGLTNLPVNSAGLQSPVVQTMNLASPQNAQNVQRQSSQAISPSSTNDVFDLPQVVRSPIVQVHWPQYQWPMVNSPMANSPQVQLPQFHSPMVQGNSPQVQQPLVHSPQVHLPMVLVNSPQVHPPQAHSPQVHSPMVHSPQMTHSPMVNSPKVPQTIPTQIVQGAMIAQSPLATGNFDQQLQSPATPMSLQSPQIAYQPNIVQQQPQSPVITNSPASPQVLHNYHVAMQSSLASPHPHNSLPMHSPAHNHVIANSPNVQSNIIFQQPANQQSASPSVAYQVQTSASLVTINQHQAEQKTSEPMSMQSPMQYTPLHSPRVYQSPAGQTIAHSPHIGLENNQHIVQSPVPPSQSSCQPASTNQIQQSPSQVQNVNQSNKQQSTLQISPFAGHSSQNTPTIGHDDETPNDHSPIVETPTNSQDAFFGKDTPPFDRNTPICQSLATPTHESAAYTNGNTENSMTKLVDKQRTVDENLESLIFMDDPKKEGRRKKTQIKRKKKQQFDYEQALKQRAVDFAQIYFTRVRETLADQPDLFEEFFELMKSVNQRRISKLETYQKICVLFVDYPDLVENFVGFLDQHEARYVGKYMHWLQFELNIKFLTECEQTFFDAPEQYEKITKKIVEVTSRTKNAQQILDEVTPLFQGDVQLRHMFIRLFPDLSPPPCNDEDFEVIDFSAVSSGLKEIDDFEEIPYQPPDLDQSMNALDDDFNQLNTPYSTRGGRRDSTSLKSPIVIKKKKRIPTFSPKKRSNKNIAASKLKQLATKRQQIKEQKKRKFRASPTSGEDDFHDNDEDDDDVIDDEFFERLAPHDDESCFPLKENSKGGHQSDELEDRQNWPKTPEKQPTDSEHSNLDQKPDRAPLNNEHSNLSNKSTDRNIFETLNKDQERTPSELSFRTHSLGSDPSNSRPEAKDDGKSITSNININNGDTEGVVESESGNDKAKEETYPVSPKSVVDQCIDPLNGTIVVDDSRGEENLENQNYEPGDTNIDQDKESKVYLDETLKPDPIPLESASVASADVDFNVVTTKQSGPDIVDLCSVSSSTIDSSTKHLADVKTIEQIVTEAERDEIETDNEVERIMFKIPKVTFSTPKITQNSSDDDVPSCSKASKDALSQLSVISVVKSDVETNFQEEVITKKSEVEDFNELTFPFPNESQTSSKTLHQDKSVLHNDMKEPQNLSKNIDQASAPRSDIPFSFPKILSGEECPEKQNDMEEKPEKPDLTNNLTFPFPAESNHKISNQNQKIVVDQLHQPSLTNDLTFPHYPEDTKSRLPEGTKKTDEISCRSDRVQDTGEGKPGDNIEKVVLPKIDAQNSTTVSVNLGKSDMNNSPSRHVDISKETSTSKSKKLHENIPIKPVYIKKPVRRLSCQDITTLSTEVDPLLFSEDSMTSTLTSFGLNSKSVAKVLKKRKIKKSQSMVVIPQKPPRRLSSQEITTLCTDIDPILFSEDSTNSTLISYGLKKRRLKKSEIVKLSDISSDRDYLSDNEELESRSVQGSFDMNSSLTRSPDEAQPGPSHVRRDSKKLIKGKTKRYKETKRRLKHTDIKTLSKRENKHAFSDEDDDYFESWSVESSYGLNQSILSSQSVNSPVYAMNGDTKSIPEADNQRIGEKNVDSKRPLQSDILEISPIDCQEKAQQMKNIECGSRSTSTENEVSCAVILSSSGKELMSIKEDDEEQNEIHEDARETEIEIRSIVRDQETLDENNKKVTKEFLQPVDENPPSKGLIPAQPMVTRQLYPTNSRDNIKPLPQSSEPNEQTTAAENSIKNIDDALQDDTIESSIGRKPVEESSLAAEKPENLHQDTITAASNEKVEWSREEDTIILFALKNHGNQPDLHHTIAHQFPKHTLGEVQERVAFYLKMLPPSSHVDESESESDSSTFDYEESSSSDSEESSSSDSE